MKTPHPHKDLICQWAEDTSLQIERKSKQLGEWFTSDIVVLCGSITDEFRLKPKMLSLNGFEYPEPLKEAPQRHTECWFAGVNKAQLHIFEMDGYSESLLKQRRLHLTREAAQMHFEAQIKAGGGEV